MWIKSEGMMKRWVCALVILLGMGVVFGVGASPSVSATSNTSTPLMTVLIKPGKVDVANARGDIEVTLSIPAINAPANKPFLSMGLMVPGLSRPEKLHDLSVTDTTGKVPMTRMDSKGKGRARWAPGRPIKGPTVISYHLLAENIPALSGGPPTALRIDGDSISAAGGTLIMTPAVKGNYRIAIRWDTSAMGRGAQGVSSFGNGNVTLPAGSVARLNRAFYMAGHLSTTTSGPFSSVWVTGQPPFNPRPLMNWAAKLHADMSRFFKEKTEPPYRVFLRFNPMNAGGGAAFINSFLLTYGTTSEGLESKSTLGHEMVHTFTAGGLGKGLGKWYSEGIAVYYQTQISWRAGLLPTDQYLKDLNETAATYYTDSLRNTPRDQVQANFWKDTRIRTLPYDGGAMYFAVLNGLVKRASGSKHSIDDLIREMNVQAHKHPVTIDYWLDLLRKYIGEKGPVIHHAMMAGKLMLPTSGDFGPCFRRVIKKIPQFDLGFDNDSFVTNPKIIKGLDPNSNAAKAGLRNGDQVTYAVALDGVQRDPHHKLTLRVTRGNRTFTISYLPRSAAVDAYQWERVPNIPDAACRP